MDPESSSIVYGFKKRGQLLMPRMGHLGAVLVVGLFMLTSGCATSMSQPQMGLLYSSVDFGTGATSNPAGNRVGEACAKSILGLVAWGDASIEAGRRNGGITQITSVDASTWSILGVYGSYCTMVRGK